MILWEKLGDENKKDLALEMCLGAAQRKFLQSWQWEQISIEMFPAHVNVFSTTKVVVGKQTKLELILSMGK